MHAVALELAGDVHGIYCLNLYLEQELHRLANFCFIGLRVDREDILTLRLQRGGALADNRLLNNISGVAH